MLLMVIKIFYVNALCFLKNIRHITNIYLAEQLNHFIRKVPIGEVGDIIETTGVVQKKT